MPQMKLGPWMALLPVCVTAMSALLPVSALFAGISVLSAALAADANARTITWVRASDAPTLDPHAFDEGVALTLNQQIYEPLLLRDAQGKTISALAESWSSTSDPLIWEFRLRRGVLFHDGSPFTVDDVVFSILRGQAPVAGVSPLLGAIEQVIPVDTHTFRIKTRTPAPLLPASLTHVLIMSKAWAEKNNVTQVPEAGQLQRAHTFRNANGTGPFVLVSREIGSRTVLKRNDAYWGNAQLPVDITELIYRPIPNDTERVQALVSGEADFLQDVPVNELPRLQGIKALNVSVGQENRSVFLGLNVGPPVSTGIGVEGRNPLADRRVREAISAGINRQAIQRSVLLGQSIPTGTVAPSGINGYPRQLDKLPAYDVARAKAALAEAGWPNGFKIKLDCPRDGILRAEAVCRAVGAQLAQIGISIDTVVRDGAEHQAYLRREPLETDFFLAALNVPSFDSAQMLMDLFHTRGVSGGRLNATRYSNAELDTLIAGLGSQVDFTARTQAIGQIWRTAQDEGIYIPLHVQTLAYAMKADMTMSVDIENQPKLRFLRIKTPIQ